MRRILRDGEAAASPPCEPQTLARLEDAFARAGGNVVRVQQLLAAENDLQVPYSTLTRWIREAGLRSPPQRAGEYHFAPGEEMQHDTSPHRMMMAGKPITAQCAGLVLAFSRRLFIQYYPRFTRFEAKHFLLEAACFMDGCCPLCVIDNTSVMVAAGAGADAVIAPEMQAFARTLGFGFRAHRVGHPDRKGRIERPFAYVEGNFLPARSFGDFADLNRQALAWCRDVANHKQKRALGMSPDAAYLIEKPHLRPLPGALPPVYDVLERVVDLSGYVSVDTNRYSVPERFVGQSVTVYKHPADIRICRRGSEIAVHPRLVGQRDARHTLAQHHPTPRTGEPHSGARGEAVARPSSKPRALCRGAQAARSWPRLARTAPPARDETHLSLRPLPGRRRAGPALRPVRPRPPGDAHPAAGGRRLLQSR